MVIYLQYYYYKILNKLLFRLFSSLSIIAIILIYYINSRRSKNCAFWNLYGKFEAIKYGND